MTNQMYSTIGDRMRNNTNFQNEKSALMNKVDKNTVLNGFEIELAKREAELLNLKSKYNGTESKAIKKLEEIIRNLERSIKREKEIIKFEKAKSKQLTKPEKSK